MHNLVLSSTDPPDYANRKKKGALLPQTYEFRMWHNLSALFDKLSVDPNVRAVVFSGAGRAFTAGLDVQAASEGGTFAPPTVDSARKANGSSIHRP